MQQFGRKDNNLLLTVIIYVWTETCRAHAWCKSKANVVFFKTPGKISNPERCYYSIDIHLQIWMSKERIETVFNLQEKKSDQVQLLNQFDFYKVRK